MKSKEYKQGNIQGFTAFIAERFNIDRLALAQALQQNFPAFQQKERCPNCDANMEVRLVTAGIHDALLLLKMGEAVRHEQRKGTEFSEANRVHTPSLPTTDAVRHTTTLASYLDLIWQPEKWRNSGYWLITDWGWKALRGEPVPKRAKYFRGKLIERSTEVTTLSEMFQTHKHEVERAIARGRAVKADYRADVATYNPIEWTGFGGYEAGKLFS